MNKKGATFEGWMYGIVGALVFILIFGGIVISDMNDLHGGSYEVEGFQTSAIRSSIEDFQDSTNTKLGSGDVSFLGSVGLTLSTSWDILFSAFTVIGTFLLGGWINTIGELIHAPSIAITILIGVYNIAIAFIVLQVLFNRKV